MPEPSSRRPRRSATTRWSLLTAALAGAGAAALLAGCAAGATAARGAGASERLPSERLTDWVSYTDQVSIVEVTGEAELPAHPLAPGEPTPEHRYVGRRVTITIADTLWRRPNAPTAASQVSFVTDGWTVHGAGDREPVAFGNVRFEPGGRYLVALTRFDDGEWGPLSLTSVLPVDADGHLGRLDTSPHQEALRTLMGRSLGDARHLLATADADPRAVQHATLPPVQRYQRIHGDPDTGIEATTAPNN